MSVHNVICAICSERYRMTDQILAGSCGHVFHEECLERWRVESRTCPICRSDDTVYLQLYLDFEEPPPSQNQSQGQSGSADSGIESVESGTEYSGIMREYENLLYETGVYREEIEYLNERIETLMLRNSQLKAKLEMSSDSD
ncbi:GL15128 [Drosophila persimilis]|uniref:E3 ubiquitin-protein ligase RNF128 isoform X2 n=2 Tax=pseudoobscura subgroup TaxID=32358 RepID=Q29J91_DROPS|nr:E3 ubiquitin-protein ligase RNF128 isoform X2 [Drosophila pseudoobscura]XP_002025552.1 E3 ubiquitin-protein ligase RNF128 [Drosophila persimilis]XP_017155968.1 E3 ubiquitin-protein ligase RNF128 [Drosophila miranda]EDW31074.1 GL15128 [Drosophila persimilis]